MTIKERYDGCLSIWRRQMPNPETELHYNSPFQLLIAVMLSAQCTDKRINMVTPAFFKAFPSPHELAEASVDDVFTLIKSVSYPNSKAKHLVEMAKMLVGQFKGDVPDGREALMSLPGVGRKTANVVLAQAFHKNAIAVDTHVFRVANRIGLAKGKTPMEVEKKLSRHIKPEEQSKAHHWILLHGRYTCKAQRPDCLNCAVAPFCASWHKK